MFYHNTANRLSLFFAHAADKYSLKIFILRQRYEVKIRDADIGLVVRNNGPVFFIVNENVGRISVPFYGENKPFSRRTGVLIEFSSKNRIPRGGVIARIEPMIA